MYPSASGLAAKSLGVVFLCCTASTATAAALNPLAQWASGTAADYSAFLFGDLDYHNSDTQRSVFVGGNANLADFRIGDVAPADLEVRGQLNFTQGYVTGGISANSPVLLDVGPPGINVQGFGWSDAGVAAAQTYYQTLSSDWALATPSGNLQQTSWGEISLSAQSGAHVFNLGGSTGPDLVLNNRFNIDLQDDSTIVINLFGDNWNLHNLGFHLNGLLVDDYLDVNARFASQIFFNFPDATQINLGCVGATGSCGGIGLPGQLLAPYAHITAINGQSIGGVVATGFSDGGYGTEFGRYQINTIPTPQSNALPIPEPSSFALLATGLVYLGSRRRKRTISAPSASSIAG